MIWPPITLLAPEFSDLTFSLFFSLPLSPPLHPLSPLSYLRTFALTVAFAFTPTPHSSPSCVMLVPALMSTPPATFLGHFFKAGVLCGSPFSHLAFLFFTAHLVLTFVFLYHLSPLRMWSQKGPGFLLYHQLQHSD